MVEEIRMTDRGFIWQGIEITNPTLSSCGRFIVDPVSTYGFNVGDTGGNCTALHLAVPGKGYFLITDMEGISHKYDKEIGSPFMFGIFDEEGLQLAQFELKFGLAADDAEDLMQTSSTLNDRYAESIIEDRAGDYDALEIHGVRDLHEPGDSRGTCCEVDDEDPQFFSVYVHLKSNGDHGGVECVGDFATHPLARQYAKELGEKYGWAVKDFIVRPQ